MFLFPRIFVVFWIVAGGGLAGAAWLGLRSSGGGPPMLLAVHMLCGLGAAFLALLLHTAVMMHTVGTGRALKLAQPHLPPDRDFPRELLRYKNLCYPIATLSCLAVVAATILGGAANFGAVDLSVHRAFVWGVAALHMVALPWEYFVTRGAARLNAEVEVRLKEKVAELEARGELPPADLPMPWQ